jgi:flavin reductase (DIM6/NTAB) family NADH-FMN oxidoreductase RutF
MASVPAAIRNVATCGAPANRHAAVTATRAAASAISIRSRLLRQRSLIPTTLGAVEDRGAEQRSLFRRWPAGVSVVVAEVGDRRHGLTVSSLASLSLDPPLVGISIALQASLHELLKDAGEWAVSILAGDQEKLAQHFARSVPPIALWDGIELRDDDPRFLAGAAGWLVARTVDQVLTGDHTFFVGEVVSIEEGTAPASLVYVHRGYTQL